MHRSSTSAVRLLAAWQLRRRELSDRLDSLLLHGPTAVDRVASRADELRQALEAERVAFEAFVDVAERTPVAPSSTVTADVFDAADAVVDLVVYPRLRAVTDAGV